MSRGILLCAYSCADTLDKCLAPWLELKEELGLIISCVSVTFKEYKDLAAPIDNTHDLLQGYLARHQIDFLVTEPQFLSEHEARNLALQSLLSSDVSIIQLLDADEIYTEKEIRGIYKFVDKIDDVCWFSLHFRNYIFDGRGYIGGFCPPRVFRTHYGNLSLSCLYWDNDFVYHREDGTEFRYKNLPQGVIPKTVARPRHYTWPNSSRGQAKVEYQQKHFGLCSYRWSEINGLEFDPEYYKKIGEPIPELHYD